MRKQDEDGVVGLMVSGIAYKAFYRAKLLGYLWFDGEPNQRVYPILLPNPEDATLVRIRRHIAAMTECLTEEQLRRVAANMSIPLYVQEYQQWRRVVSAPALIQQNMLDILSAVSQHIQELMGSRGAEEQG